MNHSIDRRIEETHYTCRRTAGMVTVDGRLDEASWIGAEKSPRFSDMVTGHLGLFDTRAAALWDEKCLYIGFWVEEPFVQGDLTEKDSLIFQENDVEVFIDGGDAYYELEVNARGTIYEVFYVWQDACVDGGRFDVPEFDVRKRKALTFGGNDDRKPASFWRGTHPRGYRWAFRDWDFPGLELGVSIDGTLNDDTDIDRGWVVEIALPWEGMRPLANGRSLPPTDGDVWRLLLARFQRLNFSGQEIIPHPAWCWSPLGVYDAHLPERYMYLHFSDEPVRPDGRRQE